MNHHCKDCGYCHTNCADKFISILILIIASLFVFALAFRFGLFGDNFIINFEFHALRKLFGVE